jgi:hypothetical protein
VSWLGKIARATFGMPRPAEPVRQDDVDQNCVDWRCWAWKEATSIGKPTRPLPEILSEADELLKWVFLPFASVDRNPEGEDRNGLRAEHESAAPKADAKPLSPKDIQGDEKP